jgi:hypothetical protein
MPKSRFRYVNEIVSSPPSVGVFLSGVCVCLYRPINTQDRSWPSNDYKSRCTYVKEILSSRTFRLLVCFLVRSRARARTSVSIAALVLLCRFACLLRIQAFKLPLACLERENWIKNFVNSCKRQGTRQRLAGERIRKKSLVIFLCCQEATTRKPPAIHDWFWTGSSSSSVFVN